jgi:hypothetical protein
VAATTLVLWAAPVVVRAGVGVPLREGRDPTAYLRLGLSF